MLLKLIPKSNYIVPLRFASLLKPPPIQKTNWKENVVYLYQFKRSPVVPNLSPFCLKVETYLRANNIKHEIMGTYTIRSKQGKLPFIELNGQQIADSQFILFHLQKYFKLDEKLDTEQRGIARAVDRMIDTSTSRALTYFRVFENATNLFNPNVSGLPIPGFLSFIPRNAYYKTASRQLYSEGIGRHPREEVVEILRRDLQAIDDILGDKKFLLGIRPTIPDFTMFGHLASCYYLPFRQPVTDLIDDNFPRIREHLDRMRIHYWSDWKRPEEN
jgi:glutathione S-transferase